MSICQVFKKMFDKETFHKMLSYAFLKIPAQNAREFDAAVCLRFNVSKNGLNDFAKTSL